MNYDEEVCESLIKNYNLLSTVVSQNALANNLKVDLSKIEKIINKQIPETLRYNAPVDFYDLYTDFKLEYEKFRDFILYDKLIGKNIVALGGGFSSGKSSFLNELMGKQVLPADIDPSTSVPTYIVRGDKNHVQGINIFNTKIEMKPRDIRKISHGFGEILDEDNEEVTKEVTLGHILNNIFLSTPLNKYDNIAFLDTPGYSKPDSEEYSTKTDEQIARGQLNSSNYILWFVQADHGTITEEDIKFIKTLNEDIPKFIVVNKADKKNLRDLKNIIDKIKAALAISKIEYIDVAAFSSAINQVEDSELKKFIEQDMIKLRQQIEKWDRQVYESNFAINFKRLFDRCSQHYDTEIATQTEKLNGLNKTLTKLCIDNLDYETIAPLESTIKLAKAQLNDLKLASSNLKQMQNLFFSEIKIIADIVGIAMPTVSEIDSLIDGVQSKVQPAISNRARKEVQESIKPIISSRKQTKRNKELVNIIKKQR